MSLLDEIEGWRVRLAALDAASLAADGCATLVGALARLGKACDAARARLAARAEAGRAHTTLGFADGAEWLARASGTTEVEARRATNTALSMPAGSAAESAWWNGELSVAQASEIAKTEAVRPGSSDELLAVTRSSPLRVLQEKAQHLRLTAIDPAELARRPARARHL